MEHNKSQRSSEDAPFLVDEEKDVFPSPTRTSRRERWAHLLPYSGVINIILILVLLAAWGFHGHNSTKAYIPDEIYSPAQSAVEYETVVFSGGLREEVSKFRGSTSDVDDEWDTLYNRSLSQRRTTVQAMSTDKLQTEVLISQISPESAAKLPNATTPFTNDTSHYIVELDVFHQLHCLNMMRKLVYPGVYTMDLTSGSEKAIDNIFHMEHCYEQLRQSLQCSSDISTIYWEWSEKKQRMFGNVRTTHTCKNFGKIRDWAVKHKAQTDLDFYKHVEGAPLLQE